MRRLQTILIAVFLLAVSMGAAAQTIQNASYQTVGYIKTDGTIQDRTYRTIGHNIPRKWAVLYFFFRQ